MSLAALARQMHEAGTPIEGILLALFPSIWFDEETTQAGRDALGWYHEKKDEARGVGLGPEHDWASHGADAFGLMAVSYEVPQQLKPMDLSNLKRGIV